MASHRPHPLGPLPDAGLDILAIVATAPQLHQTRYQVRYHCCGAVGETPHSQIRRRVRFHAPHCHHCYRARHDTFPVGPLPAAGLDILAVLTTGAKLRDALYEVRYHCCDRVAQLGDGSVSLRLKTHATQCNLCANLHRHQAAKAPSGAARTGGLDLVDRYWPRPASLAGQSPLIWGAQP